MRLLSCLLLLVLVGCGNEDVPVAPPTPPTPRLGGQVLPMEDSGAFVELKRADDFRLLLAVSRSGKPLDLDVVPVISILSDGRQSQVEGAPTDDDVWMFHNAALRSPLGLARVRIEAGGRIYGVLLPSDF